MWGWFGAGGWEYSVIIQLFPWHESGDLWLSESQSITEDDLPSRREEKCARLQRKQKNVYPLTESHNVREGDGGRRKWRVSVWKSEGARALGRSTMRCHFFFALFVCWCIERICLPAMSGSVPCGFLLSGSLFIFYTLHKFLLMSTSLIPGGFHLNLLSCMSLNFVFLLGTVAGIKPGHVKPPPSLDKRANWIVGKC